ncbi:MAG: alkaline phosphatase family protein [Flammeovirgaceae bacterium]|nr:MAG: alkaline phosphatase family protein [Flammeovirgaceae bacterium]
MRILVVILFSGWLISGYTQSADRPKLVVGIMVDQMRQEYVYRYYDKFGEGGFKRLVDGGFMLSNAHYNYVPTYTGPGHASVYTGTTPAYHGIIGNNWYDKNLKKVVYCASDETRTPVGSETAANGRVSPHRMLTTTITDELKLATQKRSKVIAIADKDRGAALPGGHMADGAYWYDEKTGKLISSSYYMSKLPLWAEKFNMLKLADKYLDGVWNTLLPIEKYTESGSDNSPYESRYRGETKNTFPYDLKALRKTNGNYELLPYTPFSNDYLTEAAFAAIEGEKLGADEVTDFLCLSYSAPDKIGHQVGPNAVELQDVYLRLDRNIADLLKKLDQVAGNGNYIVFLTADHGVADVPQYLTDSNVPAGYLNANNLNARFGTLFMQYFQGKKVIEEISEEQIYLDHELFEGDPKSGGVELMVSLELISNFLLQQEGIAQAFTRNVIRQGDFNEGGIKGMVIRGYHEKRSGDIITILEPGWLEQGRVTGTTHGSPYSYDTHVPVIFYGKGIKPGMSSAYHPITDIAPTLAVLLKVKFPNGCTGQPIVEITDR